jgi:hypothetical protein
MPAILVNSMGGGSGVGYVLDHSENCDLVFAELFLTAGRALLPLWGNKIQNSSENILRFFHYSSGMVAYQCQDYGPPISSKVTGLSKCSIALWNISSNFFNKFQNEVIMNQSTENKPMTKGTNRSRRYTSQH